MSNKMVNIKITDQKHDKRCNMEQLLYHYTDFSSLDGILNKRELRINNVLNMNDSKEMDLFISGLFDVVKKRFSEEQNEKMISRLDKIQTFVKNHYFDLSAYAACFSEARDDAAQWERYANRGKGVCLCFSKEMLEKLTDDTVALKKVIYQSNIEDHPLADRMFETIQKKPHLWNTIELKEIVSQVCRISAAYKHPSFSSENEIRLVVMPFDVRDIQLRPQYHVTRERIKKYYPLNLKKMCHKSGVKIEELITEVMVGPESTQSPPILRDYLQDLGYKKLSGNVSTSDCPLRSKM